MTTYILTMTQNQLVEKEGIILDLRDDKKRMEDANRQLEKKVMDLEFQLKHKDKEQQYAVNDALAGQPKGLAGIGEIAQNLPPEAWAIIGRFLPGGAAMAPAAAAPQLATHLSEGQRQIIQYLTECASESEAQAAKIYAIVSQGLNNTNGLEALISFCQTAFPQLRAA